MMMMMMNNHNLFIKINISRLGDKLEIKITYQNVMDTDQKSFANSSLISKKYIRKSNGYPTESLFSFFLGGFT